MYCSRDGGVGRRRERRRKGKRGIDVLVAETHRLQGKDTVGLVSVLQKA